MRPIQLGQLDSANWTLASTGLPSYPSLQTVAVDPVTPTTLYAGTYFNGIYKLTIVSSSNSDHVFWPASFTGYALQSTPSLAPAHWENVLLPPATNDTVVVQ